MSKLLIHTNQSEHDAAAAAFEQAKDRVQAIVDLYNGMGLDELTALEFQRLFTDTPALIFDKITGGNVSIAGVLLNRTKAMEIIDKPVGYDNLITAIAGLGADGYKGFFFSGYKVTLYLAQISSLFTLGEDSSVEYSVSTQSTIDEAGKHYVSSDRAKAVFHFAEDVVAAFFARGLDQYHPSNSSYNMVIPAIVSAAIQYVDYTTETFTTNVNELTNKYDR